MNSASSRVMSRIQGARGKRAGERKSSASERNNGEKVQDDVARADWIERSMIEAATSKRRYSNGSSQQPNRLDRLLEDENNDWLFEKILDKFENLRSRKAHRNEPLSSTEFDTPPAYGVERIIERRYYIKKSTSTSKRDQITSTSDLRDTQRKYRQLSGVSNTSAGQSSCSQCSSSTPTYVENLREQSDSLRHEIVDLKSEIEQLQRSQREFFEELQSYFRTKDSPSFSKIGPSSRGSPMRTAGNLPVPLTTTQKSRSVSTESQVSSLSTRSVTPTPQPIGKSNAAASDTSARSTPSITEFTATKNPSIPPAPIPPFTQSNTKPPTPPALNSRASSVISPAPVPSIPSNASIPSKPPAIPRAPITEFTAPRNSVSSNGRPTSVASKTSSITATSVPAGRPVLSPRSQILASSASVLRSASTTSASSVSSTSGSNTPELQPPKSQPASKTASKTLLASELKDLAQYSSQLEISGFPSSKPKPNQPPLDPIAQYVESVTQNMDKGLPPIPRANPGNQSNLGSNRPRQLDKYDLEIKPVENLTPTAPFLMPPFDSLP